MEKFTWLCLTAIAIIAILHTKETLCYYWDCKYGTKQRKQEKTDDKPLERKVIKGFARYTSPK